MATKVWAGSDLVFTIAISNQAEFMAVAAAWPTDVNGDTGTVAWTTSQASGRTLIGVLGSLFDDSTVPADITIDAVKLEFDWALTNGAAGGGGGATSSTIGLPGYIESQSQGSFSGHYDRDPAVLDIFSGTTRADLFVDPSIGWEYIGFYAAAFGTNNRAVEVTNYTVTVDYTPATTPTITSVTPSSGSVNGGQTVTIRGEGFTGAPDVLFGSVSAASFVVVDDLTITAVTPPHTVGAVDVEVSGVATLTGGYTFVIGPSFRLDPLPRDPIAQRGGGRGR